MSTTQTSDYSSLPSGQSMDISQDNDPQKMSPKESMNSQPIGSQTVRRVCPVNSSLDPKVQTSQWKGSSVVNYKTFKKCLHNSQNTRHSQPIPLRTVENDFQKNSQSLTEDELKDNSTSDSEKLNKRKADFKEEDDSGDDQNHKKARILLEV